jgi:hypothetical protein
MHERARRDRANGGGPQNTGRESKLSYFCGDGWLLAAARYRYARQGISVPPVQAAACPLSVQVRRKLMQKIHTLTDN